MLKRLKAIWNPYSVEGLRLRASKLPKCPYRLILEMCADQLEAEKVDEHVVRKVVEYARTGNQELLSVAVKMLNLSEAQIDVALHLARKMKESK